MIVQIKELMKENNSFELFYHFKEQLLRLYNQLSKCDKITDPMFIEFVNRSNVYLYVNERLEILGAITALYERKIIHNGGVVCHIEDFVVDERHRGKKIGEQLLTHVINDAQTKKCYKIILDCSTDMKSYYEKYKFTHKNIQMSYYF